MKILIVLLCIFTTTAFASEALEIKNLMGKYLHAIGTKSQGDLKSITTKKYFIKLEKSKALKKSKYKNTKIDKDKLKFDMIYKKGAKSKDLIFVNIKDNSKKEYGDYWYLLKREDGQLLIDDMRFQD